MDIDVYLRGAIVTPARNLDHKLIDELRNFLFDGVGGDPGQDLVRCVAWMNSVYLNSMIP